MMEEGRRGFTLIELSIVLVIIGLIVGGILVGRELITAAGIRATLTQLEKYNTAANTFREKYGYLPGDIPPGPAAQFGLVARSGTVGNGDGNGVLTNRGEGAGVGFTQAPGGETTLFWDDLSSTALIEGGFTLTSTTTTALTLTSTPGLSNLLPPATIGRGNFFYVYSANLNGSSSSWSVGITNFYGLSAVTQVAAAASGSLLTSTPALTVYEASSIDSKIDDGFPQSGRVRALYLNDAIQEAPVWAAGGGVEGSSIFYQNPNYGMTLNGVNGSPTSCYDNGGVYGIQKYSIEISGGAGVNCALSFQMQAGD